MNRIQQGTGPHVLVTVFCGVVVQRLAKILGPTVSVHAIAGSRETAEEARKIRALRDATHEAGGELWLAGFSAGGGAVRRMLDVVDPHGAIICDGGAVSLPGRPQTMPPREYARFIELARMGARQFIASHTYLTYVEQLPPAQGPYRSTVGTLRDLTGLELPEPAAGQSAVTTLGAITILSYESGAADAPAHARQVQQVLPHIVETYLSPRFSAFGKSVEDQPKPSKENNNDANGGDSEITPSGADTVAAVVAVAGSIKAAVISAAEQFADALTDRDVKPENVYLSHGYRCAVAELVADARRLGRWHDVGAMEAYQPKVGDEVISRRSGEDPRHGGKGHVERIVSLNPIMTIGGNESNTWIEAAYDMLRSDLAGIIDVDARIGVRAVELSRAELAAGVAEKPGPASHPRIQAYHAGARRGGSDLAGMPGHETEGGSTLGKAASDEIAWCASAASWAAYCAALEVMA